MKILDVGSGDNPFKKATVLCDLYLKDDRERAFEHPIVIPKGKDFVCCDAHYLPFKESCFGYVNCSNVLEHASNPSLMVKEMKRVAKHGYIQTPSWLSENILYGWNFHKWTITVKNGILHYQKIKRIVFLGSIFNNLYEKVFLWRIIHRLLANKYFNILFTKYHF